MKGFKDIGKIVDDFFQVSEFQENKDQEKPVQAGLYSAFTETPDSSEAPADGKLLENIRRIREQVKQDFLAIDESVRKSLEQTDGRVPSDDQATLESTDLQNTVPGTPTNVSGRTLAQAASKTPEKPEKPAMEELDELIGLTTIKKDVKELISLVKTQQLRKERGLKTVPVSLHLVFSGNPGTGKTTVARILARLYKEIGVLSGGQLVEVDRSGLVAGYIGQTAIRTQEKLKQALGGVLFIDEAYTLAKEGQDYGQEAIDTILKAMEDHRENLVVIVAGYTELMKKFIDSNPGLKSRFNKYMEFPDYTADELMAIFDLQCKKYDYVLTEDARLAVRKKITEMEACKQENFANARDVRNLFEIIITNHAARIASMKDPGAADLKEIRVQDLEEDDVQGTVSKEETVCPIITGCPEKTAPEVPSGTCLDQKG